MLMRSACEHRQHTESYSEPQPILKPLSCRRRDRLTDGPVSRRASRSDTACGDDPDSSVRGDVVGRLASTTHRRRRLLATARVACFPASGARGGELPAQVAPASAAADGAPVSLPLAQGPSGGRPGDVRLQRVLRRRPGDHVQAELRPGAPSEPHAHRHPPGDVADSPATDLRLRLGLQACALSVGRQFVLVERFRVLECPQRLFGGK